MMRHDERHVKNKVGWVTMTGWAGSDVSLFSYLSSRKSLWERELRRKMTG